MSAEPPRSLDVQVSPAAPEQAPLLANLLELYAHDLSEFFDVHPRPDGRFGYPLLPHYWEEETRRPFLVHADGRIAGFALIAKGSRITGDPGVWDVAEFFILRGYRRHGAGVAAAVDLWRRLPGRWEVRVLEGNLPARAFWRSAIDAFTGS